jgi:hypothetical protein
MNIQTFRGKADYWSKNHRKFFPWGFAMNGQTARLETTRQIIFKLRIRRIIETGTFRGTTTEWFGQFGLPVETVEINDRLFAFSKARLSKFENISVILDSSVHFLRTRIALDTDSRNESILFYLDSHWEEYLPLREELELIFGHYSNAVVLVDDFKVPDDAGYGYDDYGPGKALTLDYVAASKVPKLSFFSPSIRSGEETGYRRGWVVLTSNEKMTGSLREIGLLRERTDSTGELDLR